MRKIISLIFVVLIFGGVMVYFITSGIMTLCKKASSVSSPQEIIEGAYVSAQIEECGDYFLQVDHSVDFIHTHYTRYYLIPLDAEGTRFISVCAGENMFEKLDALADGGINAPKFVHIDGLVKPLDSSTRQTIQQMQQNMANLYGYDAPTIMMYYIDLQTDSCAVQSILAGFAIPLIVLLGWLTIKLAPRNKAIARLLLIPTLGLLIYLIYFLVVFID